MKTRFRRSARTDTWACIAPAAGLKCSLRTWARFRPQICSYSARVAGTFARDPSFIHRTVVSGDSSNNVFGNLTEIDGSQFTAGLGPLTSFTPLVFQRWDPPGSGGTYNNHAIGIQHASGAWRVFNQDLAAMPHGAGFHVLAPSPFADYAFKVRSPSPAAEVVIDHPRSNDNPCTHLLVNAAYGDPLDPSFGAAYIPAELIVAYKDLGDGAGEWVVRRGDGLPFPASTALHVYVDPKSSRHCLEERPFNDGFE
ncbi:MAG: hypothetical protein IPK97_00040 [Ahniella sp.]|nr:hypothetical protein [Ahniella sp.]